MNYEANAIYLRQMKAQITTTSMSLDADPIKSGTHSFNQLIAKISEWERRIELMRRDLKSQAHHNAAAFSRNRFGPSSYSAKQSFTSKTQNIETLRTAIFEVAHALAVLLEKLHAGGSPEKKALEGMKHAVNNIMKDHKSGQEFGLGGKEQVLTASVRQLESGAGGPPSQMQPGGIIDIFTLVLSYFALIKAMRNRKS